MNNTSTKFGIACAAMAALCLTATSVQAQCTTCAVPQVAYSPVVYNNYTTYDGWYLGKYVGRLGRRIFGPAPAPAYQVGYAPTYAAYPQTYAASYAPTYAASYAPACTTCGTSPCACAQTTYRPVVMQPVTECTTCYAPACNTCNTCSSGVTQATYDAPAASSCPTCNTSSYVQSTVESSPPSLPSTGTAPPRTFQETDRMDPIPAEESADDQNADWNAPMLLDPNDRLTKRPTAPVWTAVYKKPATITSISATKTATTGSKKTLGWTSGR
jgi:hypothetical protein